MKLLCYQIARDKCRRSILLMRLCNMPRMPRIFIIFLFCVCVFCFVRSWHINSALRYILRCYGSIWYQLPPPPHRSVTVAKSRNTIRAALFRAPPAYSNVRVFHLLTDGLKVEWYSWESDGDQLLLDRDGHIFFLFCTTTNKCTIISQIITLLHVSTLSCYPQTPRNQ